ncbi:urate hydroxylase PuuD [Xanthomonadaceae bacterium XH05]|nr:urate hydroxylase PuuD [Xanthomonadaceae bacterium XH05]
MAGFWIDAGTFLLRWLHVVAAIAWIGESFYFVALDRGLKAPRHPLPGLAGESWSVHGGGFYHKQKYLPAPAQLPDDLHWSKWKSYTTWLSGFALLAIVYFASPAVWLVDPRVAALSPTLAVFAALALLLGAWCVYHVLCHLIGFRDRMLGGLVGALVLALCLIATSLFAGRAAFLLVGAALATIMSANVFFVIIPGQKRMVAALEKGETPNPLDGARGKQRSVHNTYFTLPVVFAMLSTHYAAAWSHPHSGWILALFMAAAAAIRQFFVLWHSGRRAWWLPATGVALLAATFAWLAPTPLKVPTRSVPTPIVATDDQAATETPNPSATGPSDDATVLAVLAERCGACHAAQPSLLGFPAKGMIFDSAEQIRTHAASIHQQTVVLKIMPPGNMTRMTEAERELVARWFDQQH